ncbi:hypothetical protein [Micromonospora sp. WMMD998]|uniref:LppU/SCO3897 family protein n=1 Tax=Micromonospora sp. WMMD998 TaxID=3016092 RepID=UPI00249C35A7|nr:hypothetical protein [Micromonospora sp. WMMD998]WFE37714.1 hypothetical protein O7619_04395 [Micromonospora sp. WMMD998]
MTSEAPHRPGQEPGEVSPGTGGPVPYGDQPAQQDNGYNGTPDLGWAPPPPPGRPAPSAPAWADDQPPAWAPPAGQQVTGRATAQVPPSADQGGHAQQPAWGASEPGAPAWAAPGQGGPAWPAGEQTSPDRAAEPAPPAWAATPPNSPAEPTPPAWAAEPNRPAWGAGGPPGEQPAWAQPGDARDTGYVPAPATVPNESWVTPTGPDDPHRSGGYAPAAQQSDDAGHSGGWAVGAQPDDPSRSGGWPPRDEQPGAQPDDANRSGSWTPRDTQPAWAPPGQQTGATWPPAEPPARAAAKVSVPGAVRPDQTWSTPEQSEQDSRSAGSEDDPHRSGGWSRAGGPPHDDPPRSADWPAPSADNRAGGWDESTRDDDPDRSGGWPAGGRAPALAETPQPGGWAQSEQPPSGGWAQSEQPPSGGWNDAPALPQRGAGEQAGGWSGGADVPPQREPERPTDDPAPAGWGSAAAPEAPARASASVSTPDAPSGWAVNPERAPERPVLPDAEPWSPAEAWGHADGAGPAPSRGWQPAEDGPAYQPAPAPGISPGNVVPLPAQGQRVPGAALAASPPADHPAAAQFAPAEHEPERGDAGWGAARPEPDDPQSPDAPVIPGPRTSPEASAPGAVSASASVPVASRVSPPSDQPVRPTGTPTPQPRVYGRPARPEPEEAAGPDEAPGYPGQDGPSAFTGARSGPDDAPGYPGSPSRPDDVPGYSRPDSPHGYPGPQSRPDGPPGYPGQDGPHGYPGQDGPSAFAGPQAGSGDAAGYPGPQSRSGEDDPRGYGDAPSSPAGPSPFPVGVPSFVDPPGNNRPANGVHPHDGEQTGGPRDPFGGPGGQPSAFGGPGGQPGTYGSPAGHPDAFPGPGGRPEPFGGPPDPFGAPAAGGRASVAVPGQGEPGGFPPPRQAPPAWSSDDDPAGDPAQGRFDAFKPDAEPQTEAPAPKVRNGRVLAAVLVAAVLILAVPLGLLTLLGKIDGGDKPAGFDPAVGTCIKQSGESAVATDCGQPGAFTVVSKVDNKDKCADLSQPTVVLQGDGTNRVLCLKPSGQ